MGLFKKNVKKDYFMFDMDKLLICTSDFTNAYLDGVLKMRLIKKDDITIKNDNDYLFDTSLLRITPKMYDKASKITNDDIFYLRIMIQTLLESSLKDIGGTYTFSDFNKSKNEFIKKAIAKIQSFANNEGVIIDYILQQVY